MNSTLSGHTDHSEFDLTSPLISISFGQSAVFLLGGQTKAIKPTAMFVRSGDIVILAGKSRLSYHGVPKILSIPKDGNAIDCLSKESLDFAIAKDFYPNSKIFRNWMEIYSYMQESRINISVRQVFAKSNT
jgi:alkylated DNA repair protein alkB family protein 1